MKRHFGKSGQTVVPSLWQAAQRAAEEGESGRLASLRFKKRAKAGNRIRHPESYAKAIADTRAAGIEPLRRRDPKLQLMRLNSKSRRPVTLPKINLPDDV